MTVYLDLLFLFNFFVNAFFLYILELIYRERASRLRIVAGGLRRRFVGFCVSA